MADEIYARKDIARELERIRRKAPSEAETQREYHIADSKYREHILEGQGDTANGSAIRSYYSTRQAYKIYAEGRGFKLEVK